MANASNKLNFRVFADDTNIFFSHKNAHEIEKNHE